MGLLSNLFNKNITKIIQQYEAENKRKSVTKNTSNIKDFVVKTMGFINSYGIGRDTLTPPEYDFEEIKMAAEADSYIKMSLDKPKRLIYKAGYYLKSENGNAVKYINQRFRIMSYATSKPMDILFQEIADDLITYSNCILIKNRMVTSIPGMKTVNISKRGIVCGYSRVDPATMTIQRDECGNILSYTQIVNGKKKKYECEDVIHIYINKESSNAFGTPKIIAALEDVKLLRKLEGNILTIVHRFAIPIFHWKIGKAQVGFQATPTEVEEARREIENMALDGVVITNERTEIKVLGAEGAAINLSQYLNYFEKRVITALDSSESQMGRGGAKQDADSMEAQSHDYVKYVQKVLSIFIENYILSELLLEGGFNPIINERDFVSYVFNEINLETKLKLENHELLKYQSNMQTIEEARRNIGYKEKVDEDRLYKNMIEVTAQIAIAKGTAEAEADATIKSNKVSAEAEADNTETTNKSPDKQTVSTTRNGKQISQEPNKAAENNNRPTNQHGKFSVKIKENINVSEKVIRNKKNHYKKYNNFYSKLEKLRNTLIETDNETDYLFSLTKDSLLAEMREMIADSYKEGFNNAKKDLAKMNIPVHDLDAINLDMSFMNKKCEELINGTLELMKEKMSGSRDAETVSKVIETYKYRLRFMIEYELPKTCWYVYAKCGHEVGLSTAKVIFNNSEDAKKYAEFIDLANFTLDEIPAFHPFCDCKLKFIKKGAK